MTRRSFLALAGAAAAPAAQADITVGITSDTRPDWNGADNFLRSIQECADLGFRWIETFWPYVSRWENRPEELADILGDLGLKMETVSNGGAMNTNFERPADRDHEYLFHVLSILFGPEPRLGVYRLPVFPDLYIERFCPLVSRPLTTS